MTPVVRAEGLSRRHGESSVVRALSLEVGPAESLAILGPSGCGKTTLLHMLGLLDRPSAGRVLLDGVDVWAESSPAQARLRLLRVGFVFQQNNLFGHLSARENIALPAWRRSGSKRLALGEADAWIERLGLAQKASAPGRSLSGGEAQRVAIARALINRPSLVLADEPTGSVDSRSAGQIIAALLECCTAHQAALIVVTHDRDVASRMARSLSMRDGAIAPEAPEAHEAHPGGAPG
ncbi:MAG: ABC transporter ATP-binding protein [Myxococcales bacterium]|nr:ABC transporter ATP-binding protein [Myxococcales bacterium]